jgi:hypothetical protein
VYTGRNLENPVTGKKYEIKMGNLFLWSWKSYFIFQREGKIMCTCKLALSNVKAVSLVGRSFWSFLHLVSQNIWTSTIFLLYGLDLPKWETDSCILSKKYKKTNANKGNTCLPRCISFAFGTLTLSVSFTSGLYDIHKIQEIRRKKEATLV